MQRQRSILNIVLIWMKTHTFVETRMEYLLAGSYSLLALQTHHHGLFSLWSTFKSLERLLKSPIPCSKLWGIVDGIPRENCLFKRALTKLYVCSLFSQYSLLMISYLTQGLEPPLDWGDCPPHPTKVCFKKYYYICVLILVIFFYKITFCFP